MSNGMHVRKILVIGVVGAALAMAGCSGEKMTEQLVERAASAAAGEDVDLDIDTDGGTVSISGEDGEMQIGSATLPEGFPDSFPFPDGHEVVAGHRWADAESTNMTVSIAVDSDVDAVAAFYREWLAANGHELTMDNETTGELHMVSLAFPYDDYDGTVNITNMAEEGVTLQVSLVQ